MEIDYEANKEHIELIDEQLAQLGVDSITHGELLCKLSVDALPAVSVSSTSTTRWTSRRIIVTYGGHNYELQIIEGVPISGESPLRDDQVVVHYEAAGFEAGARNFLDVAFETGVGFLPVVGDFASVYSALCDTVEGFEDAYSESTIIDKMTGVAVVTLTTHMKYIFVKGYGSSDSFQVLCYKGNSVSYFMTTVSVVDIYENDVLHTYHSTKDYDTVTKNSEYYKDYSLMAKHYGTYLVAGSIVFRYDYIFRTMNITILEEETQLTVPYEDVPING